jgi:sortase A
MSTTTLPPRGGGGGTTTVVAPAPPSRYAALPRPSREQFRRVLSTTLIGTALLGVWIFLFLVVLSPFEEGHTQQGLYNELRTELALGTVPIQAPVADGAPVAMIEAPEAGMNNLVVVEGTSAGDLRDGPGHLTGSVLPGQQGVSVLLGRSLSYGAPFALVPAMKTGDDLVVRTGQGRFIYRVTDVRVKGDPVPAAPGTGQSRLTRVTSYGNGHFGGLAPSETVYVDASLVDRKAVGSGAVGTVDPSQAPMHSQTTKLTMLELVLALQLLLIVLIGVAWARARWRSVPTWIAAVPAVIAALWVTSSVASLLLPNLI